VGPESTDATDCDDRANDVFPGGTETCDERDEDCDGTVDEDASGVAWFADSDGDGHGDPAISVDACGAPSGYVASADDCDDTDASVNPDAAEVCNAVDDDCDAEIDVVAAEGRDTGC
jgi:hypothetical protein